MRSGIIPDPRSMVLISGISFGLFAGALVSLFLHPVFRLRISPERRLRLLWSTLGSLLGTTVAGALLALLGQDAVIGMVTGLFPGFAMVYLYLEWRDERRIQTLTKLPPRQREVAERALSGQLDPLDPTSAKELEILLDKLKG